MPYRLVPRELQQLQVIDHCGTFRFKDAALGHPLNFYLLFVSLAGLHKLFIREGRRQSRLSESKVVLPSVGSLDADNDGTALHCLLLLGVFLGALPVLHACSHHVAFFPVIIVPGVV